MVVRKPSKNPASSTQKVGKLFGSRARMAVMALGSLLLTRPRVWNTRSAYTWSTRAALCRALECGRTARPDGVRYRT